VDPQGHICLADFGLSKRLDAGEEAATFVGTPHYIGKTPNFLPSQSSTPLSAPEILKQEPHGKPVDWWSLGILLFELVVGIPPFHSESMHEIFDMITNRILEFPSPEDLPLSDEVQDLISQVTSTY
jgi:serine/threonine protein kinase